MKYKRLGMMMVMFFLLASVVFAIESQQFVADSAKSLLIDEYSKKILSESSVLASDAKPGVVPDPFEKDRQQMASQIQLVTENEDLHYTIVAGDTLTVAYRDRDQVNRAAYKVSEQGEIFVPLLGAVKLAGLNRRQARERLDTMLKEYIREPRTMITVNTDGRIMVFGAVTSPGLYEMRSKWTVMEAILSAGSFSRKTAEMSSVIVIRGAVEKPLLLKLNLKKMITHGNRTDDIYVKPGDFIYVPTSVIGSLESFWNTAYGLLLQWYGLGGAAPFKGRGTFAW